MYSNITKESNAKSIFGHSMGGHGALTISMKDSSNWASVSAFSPICNPTSNTPWGTKAFTSYLGSVEKGQEYDATVLMTKNGPFNEYYDDILIDQGLDDEFLDEQLHPEAFEDAAKQVGQKVTIRRHPGYMIIHITLYHHLWMIILSFMLRD